MSTLKIVKRTELVEPPLPIRAAMDDVKLQELADSIRRRGIILPLRVRVVDGRYEIVDGHRRYTAGCMIGLSEFPVSVTDAGDGDCFGEMLDANVCREDITAAEEGIQFLQCAERYGWGIEDLKHYFAKSEDYINKRVRLIEKFPDVVPFVADRKITFGQAQQIMRCSDPSQRQYLLDQAATHGANVRTLTYMVDQWQTSVLVQQGKPAAHTPEHSVSVVPVEQPECEFCHRSDDQYNMTTVHVHTYHKRDLQAVLEGLNVPRRSALTSG